MRLSRYDLRAQGDARATALRYITPRGRCTLTDVVLSRRAINEPDRLSSVSTPVVARRDDGALWFAWTVDDVGGPEGGIRARLMEPDGTARSSELIVARGSRGGFRLGGIAALPEGGAAVTWCGDEGLAWVTFFEPNARTFRTNYLEGCNGKPSVVRVGNGGDVVVAFASSERRRVVLQAIDPGGPRAVLAEGPEGSSQPAVASDGTRFAAVWRVGNKLEMLLPDGRKAIEMTTPTTVPHAPALASCGDQWTCAWIGEDTGKLTLFAGDGTQRPARVAEVWTPLDDIDACAPTLAGLAPDRVGVTWRQSRGPEPAVYLRVLDSHGEPLESEVRVSERGTSPLSGRVGLTARGPQTWGCVYADTVDAATCVRYAFLP